MSNKAYLEEIKLVWDIVYDSFRNSMTDAIRELWFKDLTIEDYDNGVITMGIKSELKQKTLTEKYTGELARRFSDELGFDVIVNVIFTGTPIDREEAKRSIMERVSIGDPSWRIEQEKKRKEQEQKEQQENKSGIHLGSTMPPFNFEYTFDNFIVGSSNKFAHAACVAVAKMPAKNYNPLFIYGPSGIGKTHLLYAITNYLREQNPNVKVIYIKGEDFTNQMIDCLSRQAMPEFREKYRDCDVLLIDDIQFIGGKVSTQEEFFHTFNALYEGRKQIILTSDRQPREIKTLESFTQMVKKAFSEPVNDFTTTAFTDKAYERTIEDENLKKGYKLNDDEVGLRISFRETVQFSTIVLQEDLTKSQRVEQFNVYSKCNNEEDYTLLYEGTVIGFKKFVMLKKEVKSDEIIIAVTQSRGNPVLKGVKIYK